MRFLAIDFGARRIGLAVGDDRSFLATPLRVLQRQRVLRLAIDAVFEVAKAEDAQRVVLGLPLNADGTEGRPAAGARAFARTLERVLNCPIDLWDERLSTQEARQSLRAQGISLRRVRERGGIDSHAAAMFLQTYLDAWQRRGGPPQPSASGGPCG